MATAHNINADALLAMMQQKGGECTFDEGLTALVQQGMTKSGARDALWQLLSDGTIEFTTDRHLKLPSLPHQAVG
jgi:hypothetical protein